MNEQEQKQKKAIALSYDQESDGAPKIAATGKGFTAERILKMAKENNIPIQEDSSLVELLGQLKVNSSIPEELYQAVAEIFAFVYRLEKEINID